MFTKKSIKAREWSGKNTNLSIDQKDIYSGFRSVISGMSEERGFEHTHILPSYTNSEGFIEYLKKVRKKLGNTPLALFMDQLTVHKSKEVKPWYEKLNMSIIYNVSYSPAFNPIESAFSKVKRLFNRQRLNDLVNKKGFNFDRVIMQAFRSVTQEHCAACVRKSRVLLERSA